MQSAPQVTTDPLISQLQQTATEQQNQQLSIQAQGDTASLMARYGTRLALAGSTTAAFSPLSPASTFGARS